MIKSTIKKLAIINSTILFLFLKTYSEIFNKRGRIVDSSSVKNIKSQHSANSDWTYFIKACILSCIEKIV